MANDDLVRIVYRPKRMSDQGPTGMTAGSAAGGQRRSRTSISMDPDLYNTFVLIVGDARDARSQLRRWATEVDGERRGKTEAAGVSRLVHKKMLTRIREVVEAGLTVIRGQGGAGQGAGGASSADVSDWDAFKGAESVGDQQQGDLKKAAKAAKKNRKANPPPAPAVTDPGLDDADIDDAVSALVDVLGAAPVPASEPVDSGRLPPQQEFTREREPSDFAASDA